MSGTNGVPLIFLWKHVLFGVNLKKWSIFLGK